MLNVLNRSGETVQRFLKKPESIRYLTTQPKVAAPVSIITSVSGDTRIFTKNGLPAIQDLLGDEVEVWSGKKWFPIVVQKDNKQKILKRVVLTNGACIVCSDEQTWAVIDGKKITPMETKYLCPDLVVSAFIPLPVNDLGGDLIRGAYQLGEKLGELFTGEIKPKSSLPDSVYKMATQSLGRFMAGWIDSQRGNIFASKKVVHDMQILLHRIGVYETHVFNRGAYYVLEISANGMARIPNPKKKRRNTTCHAVFKHLRIESIATMDLPQPVYTINSRDNTTHTIVLDGVLTLC